MLGVHPQVIFELATRFVKKQQHVSVFGREVQGLIEVIDAAVSKSLDQSLRELFPVVYSQENVPNTGKVCLFFVKDKAFTLKFFVDGVEQRSKIIATEHEQRALKMMMQSVFSQSVPTDVELKTAGVSQDELDEFMKL